VLVAFSCFAAGVVYRITPSPANNREYGTAVNTPCKDKNYNVADPPKIQPIAAATTAHFSLRRIMCLAMAVMLLTALAL
jgi:hypothetical protein